MKSWLEGSSGDHVANLRYPEARKGSARKNWVSGSALRWMLRKRRVSSSGELQLTIGGIADKGANRRRWAVVADVPCLPQKSFFLS